MDPGELEGTAPSTGPTFAEEQDVFNVAPQRSNSRRGCELSH